MSGIFVNDIRHNLLLKKPTSSYNPGLQQKFFRFFFLNGTRLIFGLSYTQAITVLCYFTEWMFDEFKRFLNSIQIN